MTSPDIVFVWTRDDSPGESGLSLTHEYGRVRMGPWVKMWPLDSATKACLKEIVRLQTTITASAKQQGRSDERARDNP